MTNLTLIASGTVLIRGETHLTGVQEASACSALRPHKRQLDKASQLFLALAADGVELPDVHADESTVVERATAVIKRKRLELQGRSRA